MTSQLSLYLLLSVGSVALLAGSSKGPEPIDDPPKPVWPDVFSVQFYIYVQQYGENWNSTGRMYYHWTSKVKVVGVATLCRRSTGKL